MHEDDLFTAPQLASLCGVELKTIHNWIAKGMIRHFRSPGRHIRIRRVDLIEFMERFGYPIPEELQMNSEKPTLAIIDSDSNNLTSFRKTLSRKFEVRGFNDLYSALLALGAEPPSAIVINASMDGVDWSRIIGNIRNIPSMNRIPVILYSEDHAMRDPVLKAGATDFFVLDDMKKVKGMLEGSLLASA